jgi:hydrogenase maturation protease
MVLVVGYGNSLRSDDGVGIFIANRIAEANLGDVDIRTTQQLGPELVVDLARYDKIIFIDAASNGDKISVRRLSSEDNCSTASSHHMKPELLLELAQKIYQTRADAYVCTVRGECFEIGEQISDSVIKAAEEAFRELRTLILKEGKYARS